MTYKIGMRPKIKEDPVKITLYLDRKYRDLLRDLAKTDKRSPSQFVENLIVAEDQQSGKVVPLRPASGVLSKYPKPQRKRSSG